MPKTSRERNGLWLVIGMIIGSAVTYYWPAEPAYAETAVVGDKFAMCTANTLAGNSEAIFVLDMVTGRLMGAAYNTQTGTFTQSYLRNLAADFNVVENAQYVMISGSANLRSTGGGPPASGVVYVGELTSGMVHMYGFVYAQSPRVTPPREMVMIGRFQWRQAFN